MDSSFSVLIPDGESMRAPLVVHCLAVFPNVSVHVLSGRKWAPLSCSRYCRGYTFKKTNMQDGSFLDAVAGIVRKENIDILLPVDTNCISFAISNHAALSALTAVALLPDQKSFEIANNKWLLAQFLEQNNLPGPPTLLVADDDLFEGKLDGLEFPVLMKPATLSGDGEGIMRFDNLADLKRYLLPFRPEMLGDRFVIQSLVSGYDVDLNILAREGKVLASSIQQTIIPNIKKYSPPGAIKFIKDDLFSEFILQLAARLNWSGYIHVDTICDSQHNLRIVDMNARFWGSVRGSLESGISFPYLACLAGLGISFPLPTYNLIRYFHPKTALREGLLGLVGKSRERAITFSESGLRFLVSDPLTEVMRIYFQENFESALVMRDHV